MNEQLLAKDKQIESLENENQEQENEAAKEKREIIQRIVKAKLLEQYYTVSKQAVN